MSAPRITERFPVTLGVLGFYAVAIITEPFLGLSALGTPLVAAYGNVLLGMLLAGIALMILLSIAFSKNLELIRPDQPFKRYTLNQALIVILGFLGVSVWQIYVNQAVLSTILRPLATTTTPPIDPNTAFLLKIDSAISEEVLFCAVTMAVYLVVNYFGKYQGRDRLIGVATSLVATGAGFVTFHQYVLQQIQDVNGAVAARQAWYFFFGARVVLSGVLLATLWYSTRSGETSHKRTASLAAPLIIHVLWDGLF